MTITLDEFIRNLSASGLFTEEYLRGYIVALPEKDRPVDGEQLAMDLMMRDSLTPYQKMRVEHGEFRGLIVSEYTILEPLGPGAGGVGLVFKAKHRRMNRIVAVKFLPADAHESVAAAERFQKEVLAAAALVHPNIVTAYDAGRDDDIDYLVTEFVDGCNLEQLVEAGGPLPIARAAHYAMQAAVGLDYAHGKGIIHRDIKPSNLFLNRHGTVKISDMGLARHNSESIPRDKRNASPIIGTVDYMPPEQADEWEGVDARGDIYSLGSTLYFLLTGTVPFDGDKPMEILRRKRKEAAPRLRTRREDVPEDLERAVARMIDRDRRARYQSAIEVAEALAEFANIDEGAAAMDISAILPRMPAAIPSSASTSHAAEPSRTEVGAETVDEPSPHENIPNAGELRAESLHPVSTSDLPLGAILNFPLNDLGGRTLLKAGECISPNFLNVLHEKKVTAVWLHERDIRKILGPKHGIGFRPWLQPPKMNVQNRGTQKLDRELTRPRTLQIVATGPPFRERVATHGAMPYDANLVQLVTRLQSDSIARIANLMDALTAIHEAPRHALVDGNQLAAMQMSVLRTDFDLALGRLSLPPETDYILAHSLEMSVLSMAIATEMALDERNVLMVGLAGLLSDIGMRTVPLEILDAPRSLEQHEMLVVMKHVTDTAEILERSKNVPVAVRLAAYQVHERPNGKGYPRGRTKEQIHPFASILAVADVYLALISERPYRRALLPYSAMEIVLQQTSQGWFDPAPVRALLAVVSLLPLGSCVVLDDRRAGKVIRANPNRYDRPILEIFLDENGRPMKKPVIVDLSVEPDIRIVQAIRPPRVMNDSLWSPE